MLLVTRPHMPQNPGVCCLCNHRNSPTPSVRGTSQGASIRNTLAIECVYLILICACFKSKQICRIHYYEFSKSDSLAAIFDKSYNSAKNG